MHVVSRMREELPNFDLKAILIKLSGELALTNNPDIKGWGDKPFKSPDILNALKRLKFSEAEAEESEAKRKKSKHRVRKEEQELLRRKRVGEAEPPQALSESGIVFGPSYVIFEPEPEKVYRFVSSLDTSKYSILIVTSDRTKAIKERFSYVSVEVVQPTSNGRA